MRRRSGTLDIYAKNNPEQYEAEYQCIASNQYGSAYSNIIRLLLYSKLLKVALNDHELLGACRQFFKALCCYSCMHVYSIIMFLDTWKLEI